MRLKTLLSIAALAPLLSCVTPTTPAPSADPGLQSTQLQRFADEADFNRYLAQFPRPKRQQALFGAPDAGVALEAAPPPPPPPPAAAAPSPGEGNIVVTGSRAPASEHAAGADAADTITNVQTHGVDEGDIVKKIGRFLIVLQDGRLFVVNTQPDGQPGLALADRINVYRDARSNMWYDEMLVYQHRIVVTGYSYANYATEFTVFSMDDNGHLTREAVYYMSSNDYYDVENYATRLVDDKLVIYSPMAIAQIARAGVVHWPLLRRWVSGSERNAVLSKGARLFDAHEIYRPLQRSSAPTIHSISICPLGTPAHGDELSCTATAFVGAPDHEFYIAPDAAYLWVNDDAPYGAPSSGCGAPNTGDSFSAGRPGVLYRVPFGGGAPGVMRVRGAPRDQLGLASTSTEFRALLFWSDDRCSLSGGERLSLKYFSAPLSSFADTLRPVEPARFHTLPSLEDGMYEERFTDTHVVYGSRHDWSSYPPESSANTTGRVVAVPLADPDAATVIQTPHNIVRVERAGDDVILDGYRNNEGLSVSRLQLSGAPRITATELLPHRYESEGRSHAFNAHVDESDEGMMGLPTVYREFGGGRWWWRSTASDVSFLALGAGGALHGMGELTVNDKAQDPAYHCEVSCIDWYGNTRPIFADGRVFALSGVELIEGAPADGRIREVRRVNLSRPPPTH